MLGKEEVCLARLALIADDAKKRPTPPSERFCNNPLPMDSCGSVIVVYPIYRSLGRLKQRCAPNVKWLYAEQGNQAI